jgi:hypothetical protein
MALFPETGKGLLHMSSRRSDEWRAVSGGIFPSTQNCLSIGFMIYISVEKSVPSILQHDGPHGIPRRESV